MEDRQFTTYFLAVIAVLTAFTLIILIIANSLYSSDALTEDSRVQLAVAERIAPIGDVYVGSVPAEASSSTTAGAPVQVAAADLSGEDVYQQVCAACHTSGVLNAPKPGDATAWEPRLAKGVDTLYANAINGIGAMPSKGGRADMSDDAIKAAVDYLLQ